MITGKGIGFLIAAIVLLLLARLTQVGWLYLIDAVLWGTIMLSAIFPWLGAAFVSAQRRVEPSTSHPVTPGPVEGDTINVNLILRSRAFWPSYALNLQYDCPLAPPENRSLRYFVTNVSRSTEVSLDSSVEAYQRGLHHLGPVVLESSAPFGLFRRRKSITGPQQALVYPLVLPLRRLAMAEGLSGMESRSRKSRTGIDPAGSRKYAPGDPRRLIHWRNTARTGQLMVKELEDPVDRALYLLFDATRVLGEGRETTLEYAIKVIASTAHYAHRNQVPVHVLGGGVGSVQTPQASTSWPRLLKDLALVTAGDGQSLAESLQQVPPSASALILMSPANRAALQAIVRESSTLDRLAVISLEGFDETEWQEGELTPLRAAKIPVIRCRPGQLKEALRALEGVEGPLLPASGILVPSPGSS